MKLGTLMGRSVAIATVAFMLATLPVLAAEETIIGTVSAEWGEDDEVLGVALVDAEGNSYTIALDDNGIRLGEEMDGLMAEVTGEFDDDGNFRVTSFVPHQEISPF